MFDMWSFEEPVFVVMVLALDGYPDIAHPFSPLGHATREQLRGGRCQQVLGHHPTQERDRLLADLSVYKINAP